MTGDASDIISVICCVCGHHFPMDSNAVLACDGYVTCGCEVTGERPNSVDNPAGVACHVESPGTDGTVSVTVPADESQQTLRK